MAEVNVTSNLPELKSHLNRIGREFASKVVRAATRASALVYKKYARLNVPKLTGRIHSSLYVKRHKDSTSGREHFVLGVRYKRFKKVNGKLAFKEVKVNAFGSTSVNYFGAYYWRWVHEGHKFVARGKPGEVSFGTRKILVRRKNGTTYERTVKFATTGLRSRRRAATARVPGNPFLTKAYTQGSNEALAKFFSTAEKRIEKISQERTSR